MRTFEGVISKKDSTEWNNVWLHSFQIEGNNTWFKTGTSEIQQEVGEAVSFEERNGRVDVASVTSLGAKESANEAQETTMTFVESTTTSTESGSESGRWSDARRDACAIVVAAMHTDNLPHAANVAKGKRLDLILGYVNEIAEKFYQEDKDA